MKTRALVSALASFGIVLGSCAQTATQSLAQPSPGCFDPHNQLCGVEVTVTGCTQAQVTVTPANLSVKPANPNRPWTITWTMKSAGYEFGPAPAIVFQPKPGFPAAPPAGTFTSVSSSSTSVVMTDLHKGTKARYAYSIVIVKAGGASCVTKDPTVDND